MSAELLREAAALMRERAEAATPGPWEYKASGWRIGGPSRDSRVGLGSLPENAQHIASWHPAVAVAVADWLDKMAIVAATETAPVAVRLAFIDEAVKVARAYLGRAS